MVVAKQEGDRDCRRQREQTRRGRARHVSLQQVEPRGVHQNFRIAVRARHDRDLDQRGEKRQDPRPGELAHRCGGQHRRQGERQRHEHALGDQRRSEQRLGQHRREVHQRQTLVEEVPGGPVAVQDLLCAGEIEKMIVGESVLEVQEPEQRREQEQSGERDGECDGSQNGRYSRRARARRHRREGAPVGVPAGAPAGVIARSERKLSL